MSGALAELIVVLEAAKRGDRDLNLQIAKALGFRPITTLRGMQIHNPKQPAGVSWDLPNYTGSVDAALKLVPDGHRWLLDKRPYGDSRPDGYRAEVFEGGRPYESDRSDVPTHWGPTPALALVIAALRARKSQP